MLVPWDGRLAERDVQGVGSAKMTIWATIDSDNPSGRDEIGGQRNCIGAPTGDPAFDRWLNHHLSQLYDPVVQEQLPTDLMRLLQERLR
jgi:hypothetical protein